MTFQESIDYMNKTLRSLDPVTQAKVADAASRIRVIVNDFEGCGVFAVLLVANEVSEAADKR